MYYFLLCFCYPETHTFIRMLHPYRYARYLHTCMHATMLLTRCYCRRCFGGSYNFFLCALLMTPLGCLNQFVFLADGLGTKVNEEGIAYYNNLINSLLEKGTKSFALG